MTTQELALNFLREQGFQPHVNESNNIVFKYQMRTFVMFFDSDDPYFVELSMVDSVDVNDDNRELLLEACNTTNMNIKFVKAKVYKDAIVFSFELLLDSTPNLEDLVPRALNTIQAAERECGDQLQ